MKDIFRRRKMKDIEIVRNSFNKTKKKIQEAVKNIDQKKKIYVV
jgi:hypothetical protein